MCVSECVCERERERERNGKIPIVHSKIASLRYWLKLGKMPITRFPKQALIMLQNSLDTENRGKRSNWAGSIIECLESYGFQDVWAQGG